MSAFNGVTGARLPLWLLPEGWPMQGNQPQLATLHFLASNVHITPDEGSSPANYFALHGALVLPPLIEPHAHLDKTFTVQRTPAARPGLLAAIEAMHQDRINWTPDDLHMRASRAVQWAAEAGVSLLRTHIDWFSTQAPPAWHVVGELTHPLCSIERVALVPLPMFAQPDEADAIARQVATSGGTALLGGFVHSSNWDPQAFFNLMQAAERWQLDIDLHIDEELSESAQGLRWLADYLQQQGFSGHITCSHGCALAQQADGKATLDLLARHRVALIALPLTNLLLQDAVPERTPRQRGLTLLKEALTREIPVLLGADNVQDAFCPFGSYDPLDTLFSGLLSAQLSEAFDQASALICRRDALQAHAPLLTADLLIFPDADVTSWPLRQRNRYRLINGVVHSLSAGEPVDGA